jgi:hypothetical protein
LVVRLILRRMSLMLSAATLVHRRHHANVEDKEKPGEAAG